MFARVLVRLLVVMASPLSSPLSPESEILNFKQREGENLKDAWYRICNAQNRSTRKKSTSVLLRNFYVGITPWHRYVLDTITGGNFLGSHTFDSYNAMIDLFGLPPLLVNGTILTLEHVMQRLEIIENKVATIESTENIDKKIHNQITQCGSKVGMTFHSLSIFCRGRGLSLYSTLHLATQAITPSLTVPF